jgi:hypothetical protein
VGILSTGWTIQQDWVKENYGQKGTFGIVSLDPTQPIYIDLAGPGLSETIELRAPGDSATFSLFKIDRVTVRAANYPTTMALKDTTADIVLSVAPALSTTPPPSVPAVTPPGFAGPFRSTVVTVGTSAVPLPATPLVNRKAVLVQVPSDGGGTVWVGGSGVTADETVTGGAQIIPGDRLAADIGSGILEGISDGAGRKVIVLEFS